MSLSQVLIPCEICAIDVPFNLYEEHIRQCVFSSPNIRTNHEEIINWEEPNSMEDEADIVSISSIVGRDLAVLFQHFQYEDIPYENLVQIIPLLFSRSNNYDFDLTLQSVNEESNMLIGLRSDLVDVYEIFENTISVNINVKHEDSSQVEISFSIMDIACSICFEDYNFKSERIVKTKCNHFYCKKCIDEWFKRSSKCPVCNNEFDK